MQTKRQIQDLLSSAGVAPNRKLGQHFLVDLNLMRLLVDSAQIGPEDVVLEIGTGTGSLTEALAERAGRVVTVELDRALAGIAQARLTAAGNVQVVHTDVLSGKGCINLDVCEAIARARAKLEAADSETGPMVPPKSRLLLVSNLPYDVASAVMMNLVRGPVTAEAMTVTVQKEVAERMTAAPGTRDYGTLSIFLGATGSVELLRVLKPGVFWPPPQVDSAMVRHTRDERKSRRILDMDLFGEVIGLFMGHRRKMLRACAKHAPPELGGRDLWLEILKRHGIDPTRRPQELSPEQYVVLANSCHELLSIR